MRVAWLGIADTPGRFVTRPLEVLPLTWAGLEGDRHAGLTLQAGSRQRHVPRGTVLRNTRQLSVLSVEELAATAAALGVPRLEPAWLGANVVLEGAPALTAMAPSTRLVFDSGAVLVVDGDNAPCKSAGREVAAGLGAEAALAERFVAAATGRRGLVAWVERPGSVRVGDGVTLVSR